jgi:hypothetical protein
MAPFKFCKLMNAASDSIKRGTIVCNPYIDLTGVKSTDTAMLSEAVYSAAFSSDARAARNCSSSAVSSALAAAR